MGWTGVLFGALTVVIGAGGVAFARSLWKTLKGTEKIPDLESRVDWCVRGIRRLSRKTGVDVDE